MLGLQQPLLSQFGTASPDRKTGLRNSNLLLSGIAVPGNQGPGKWGEHEVWNFLLRPFGIWISLLTSTKWSATACPDTSHAIPALEIAELQTLRHSL